MRWRSIDDPCIMLRVLAERWRERERKWVKCLELRHNSDQPLLGHCIEMDDIFELLLSREGEGEREVWMEGGRDIHDEQDKWQVDRTIRLFSSPQESLRQYPHSYLVANGDIAAGTAAHTVLSELSAFVYSIAEILSSFPAKLHFLADTIALVFGPHKVLVHAGATTFATHILRHGHGSYVDGGRGAGRKRERSSPLVSPSCRTTGDPTAID